MSLAQFRFFYTLDNYLRKNKKGKRSQKIFHLCHRDELAGQPHVKLIRKLLVMQHPDFENLYIKDNLWAWAEKASGSKEVVFESLGDYLRRKAEKECKTGKVERAPLEAVI